MALIQSVVAGGRGVERGRRLSAREGCDAIFEEQANGTDLVLGPGFRLGIGYGLSSKLIPIGPRACFWGGWGGSIVVIDLDARLVVSYVMNRMASALLGDTRGADILFATAIAAAAEGHVRLTAARERRRGPVAPGRGPANQAVEEGGLGLDQLATGLGHGEPGGPVDLGEAHPRPDPRGHSISKVLLRMVVRSRSPATAQARTRFPPSWVTCPRSRRGTGRVPGVPSSSANSRSAVAWAGPRPPPPLSGSTRPVVLGPAERTPGMDGQDLEGTVGRR